MEAARTRQRTALDVNLLAVGCGLFSGMKFPEKSPGGITNTGRKYRQNLLGFVHAVWEFSFATGISGIAGNSNLPFALVFGPIIA